MEESDQRRRGSYLYGWETDASCCNTQHEVASQIQAVD